MDIIFCYGQNQKLFAVKISVQENSFSFFFSDKKTDGVPPLKHANHTTHKFNQYEQDHNKNQVCV